MKKTLVAMLVMGAFSVTASPYVGLELGYGVADHDEKTSFDADSISLEPELDSGIITGFVGYSLNDKWALEVGFSQYELEEDYTKPLGVKSIDGEPYIHTLDWDSSIKVKQFYLAPVYNYELSERWLLKFKAGVTYTQYDSSYGKYEEFELVANEDVEINNTLQYKSEDFNKVGAMASIGAEFKVLPQLTLGANAKIQADSFANTSSFNISTTYHF